ncbi:MAG TPA: cation:proton antiporter [Gammaproteobacteria bacterium]|nr:cation:proton antiporter [Gammaproteobacteria bacterium]
MPGNAQHITESGNLLLIILLLAAAVITGTLLRRARLPAVLAYLFTGVLVGPHGLAWIPDADQTRVLAEFGVVFLLFTLGLEFSLQRMILMRRAVLVLGGAQVAFTTFIIWLFAYFLLDIKPGMSLVLGAALAMSSTAVVVKQLGDQREVGLVHGQHAVAVLLFQDIAVIPFLILIPELAHGTSGTLGINLAWAAGKSILALALILIAGRWLLRPVFYRVAAARSSELFTLAVLLFTLAASWITENLGLSLALGAFLVGMSLSETEFRHQIEADIRPFRDVLLGLFFVTIGMLVNPAVIREEGAWILAAVAGLLLLKTIVTSLLAWALGSERSMALRTGLVLSEGGEFGFALLALAVSTGVAAPAVAQFALAVIVITMMVGPIIVLFNRSIAGLFFRAPVEEEEQIEEGAIEHHEVSATGHIIIAGYGRVGQNVARFLEEENFEYIALDLDPARIKAARSAGDAAFFGDATELDVLRAAGLVRARALVISYSNVRTALTILKTVKQGRPDIPVLVRTRDDSHLEALQAAGATEVIPETLEASLMVVSHLLTLLHVPASRIFRRIQRVRADRYSLLRNVFRGQGALPMPSSQAFRGQLETVTLADDDYAIGRLLADLKLDVAGVMVTALRRGGIVGRQPEPDTVLQNEDTLVLYGTPEQIEAAKGRLTAGSG